MGLKDSHGRMPLPFMAGSPWVRREHRPGAGPTSRTVFAALDRTLSGARLCGLCVCRGRGGSQERPVTPNSERSGTLLAPGSGEIVGDVGALRLPVLEKGCGMGRRGNLTTQEFHDFANVTQALIWQAVAAVMAARISIAESHQVCEQTRELLADLRRRRSEGRQGRAWRERRPLRSLI